MGIAAREIQERSRPRVGAAVGVAEGNAPEIGVVVAVDVPIPGTVDVGEAEVVVTVRLEEVGSDVPLTLPTSVRGGLEIRVGLAARTEPVDAGGLGVPMDAAAGGVAVDAAGVRVLVDAAGVRVLVDVDALKGSPVTAGAPVWPVAAARTRTGSPAAQGNDSR